MQSKTTTPPTGNQSPPGTLPNYFHQHPEATYMICREWARAHGSRATEWLYVIGLLDGIGTQPLDPESAEDLRFLAALALFRWAMAREVQP